MKLHSDWRESELSALFDDELLADDAARCLQDGGQALVDRWCEYQDVRSALRAETAGPSSQAFLNDFRARLAQEQAVQPTPVVVVPANRQAANDSVFRWKMVAGLASFAAVAAIGWSVLGGLGPQPGAGAQLAQGAVPVPGQAQVVTLMAPAATATPPAANAGAVMLRDPRLDELLAAHRQSAGASALGDAAGCLRNATFEGPGR